MTWPRSAVDQLTITGRSRLAPCSNKSLRPIAAGLEERGIPAARGGKWSAVQVARLLDTAGGAFRRSKRHRLKGKPAERFEAGPTPPL